MSYEYDDNPSAWLDAELRDVPLPPDLIARLRQLGVDDDRELDRVLRQVKVPHQLIQRLKSVPGDAEVDRRLRRVAVPTALLDGLKEIPADRTELMSASAGGLDLALERSSQPPPEPRSARSPIGPRRSWRLIAWAAAASLAAIIAIGVTRYLSNQPDIVRPSLPDQEPSMLVTAFDSSMSALAESPLDELGMDLGYSAEYSHQSPRSPESVAARSRLIAARAGAESSVLGESQSLAKQGWADARLYVSEQLAMPERLRDMRPLSLAGETRPRAWAPPPVKGFNWTELLRDGVNPFVSPADHPQLRAVHVPLTTEVGSFREYRLLSSRREAISPLNTRTEEFLAAVDFGFEPPRDGAIALHASAGPSPWEPLGRHFLLLGVQARGSRPTRREPVEMILVVDGSLSSSGWDAFAACREAIRRLTGALDQEGDRVSLILAAQRPIPLAQRLSRQDVPDLEAAIDQISPVPIADVVPSIEAAVAQAGRVAPSSRSRVVCLTSDLAHVSLSERQRLSGVVAEARARGARFDVVQLTPWNQPDATSAVLASAGGGDVRHTTSADDLWAVLYRMLTESSAVAAQDVALRVEFDPKIVQRYRILGHEAESIDAVSAAAARSVELMLDQAGAAMFEIELRSGVSGSIGTATVTWRDPQTGEAGASVRTISTAQIATTLSEAALPLQRATIAAMTAEILRGVRHARASATLQDVLHVADTLDGSLWDEPWFTDFVRSIEVALPASRR